MSTAEAPPSPADSSSPRLPLELLANIIELAVSDRIRRSQYKQASAYSRLARDIRPFAQAALWRSLQLTFDRDEEDENGEQMSDFETEVRTDAPRVQTALKAASHLGPLVRELHIILHMDRFGNGGLDEKEVCLPIRDVLEACPNITHLDVELEGDPVASNAVAALLASMSWGAQLVNLEIDYQSESVVKLLQQLPSLRHLNLVQQFGVEDDWPIPSSFPFALLSLDISGVTSTLPASILRTSLATLQEFHTDGAILADVQHILPSLTALHSVDVWCLIPGQLKIALDLLPLLPAVKQATLTDSTVSPTPVELDILQGLPPTLATLSLPTTSPEAVVLFKAILASTHPSPLRPEIGGGHRAPWSEVEVAGLVAAGRKVGIELVGVETVV